MKNYSNSHQINNKRPKRFNTGSLKRKHKSALEFLFL